MLVRLFVEERRVVSSGSMCPMVRLSGNPLTLMRLFESSLKRSLCNRKNSFTILFTLLRTTATPVLLRIVTANLLIPHRFSLASKTKWAVSEHFVHAAPRKSPLLSLSCFFRVRIIRLYSTGGDHSGWLPPMPLFGPLRADQTARLFLPFARLRLITSRPEALLMRTRKPCVLFLLLL